MGDTIYARSELQIDSLADTLELKVDYARFSNYIRLYNNIMPLHKLGSLSFSASDYRVET